MLNEKVQNLVANKTISIPPSDIIQDFNNLESLLRTAGILKEKCEVFCQKWQVLQLLDHEIDIKDIQSKFESLQYLNELDMNLVEENYKEVLKTNDLQIEKMSAESQSKYFNMKIRTLSEELEK